MIQMPSPDEPLFYLMTHVWNASDFRKPAANDSSVQYASVSSIPMFNMALLYNVPRCVAFGPYACIYIYIHGRVCVSEYAFANLNSLPVMVGHIHAWVRSSPTGWQSCRKRILHRLSFSGARSWTWVSAPRAQALRGRHDTTCDFPNAAPNGNCHRQLLAARCAATSVGAGSSGPTNIGS